MMRIRQMCKYLLTALPVTVVSLGASAAASPDCKADLDLCVRTVVAETAVLMNECGKLYPASAAEIDTAFRQWPVLRLPIPGLKGALDMHAPLQSSLRDLVAPYLKRIPEHERQIECLGRLEMVRSAEPKLGGDSAKLPPDALDKYKK
jgi:hypothetical protein